MSFTLKQRAGQNII